MKRLTTTQLEMSTHSPFESRKPCKPVNPQVVGVGGNAGFSRLQPASASGWEKRPGIRCRYVFSAPALRFWSAPAEPSSAAATSARSSASVCPNDTGSPCVSAPEDGRTPLNTYDAALHGSQDGRPYSKYAPRFGGVSQPIFPSLLLATPRQALLPPPKTEE
jgi:hypothetical protein